eukprot:5241701-Ditylum_brightwellii.AAC.2
MGKVVGTYKKSDFVVKEIHCDNEFHVVLNLWSSCQDLLIDVVYMATDEHVPHGERNNRTIKERMRTLYHCLPFHHLPRIIVKYAVMESTKKLNYFLVKHSISKHYSPRMIMHRKVLDYKCHCSFVFGEYVLGHNETNPSKTNAPRALD